jgi:acetophenone carboxylase
MPSNPDRHSDQRIRVTEYLDLDLDREQWTCNRCNHDLGPARENYKKGCLLYDRDPREIHMPIVEGAYSFSPDPLWVKIVEFYCPGCGVQMETEYLPPGHPITHDIEINIAALKSRLARGELVIKDRRLEVAA